jgi:hypothetical protein
MGGDDEGLYAVGKAAVDDQICACKALNKLELLDAELLDAESTSRLGIHGVEDEGEITSNILQIVICEERAGVDSQSPLNEDLCEIQAVE